MTSVEPTRRAFVRSVTALGGAAATTAFLAACTSGGGTPAEPSAPSEPVQLPTAEVPVGGGVVLVTHNIVVTQPTAGEYHAFSAICTHQGCPISSVEDRGAFCACHSSYFDITSGKPVAGPATTALPTIAVAVNGDTLTIG